jgi:AmmeMemoRadiSam system protein A
VLGRDEPRDGAAMSAARALSAQEGAALLDLARRAVAARVGAGPEPALAAGGALVEARGAFVAVEVGGELRGFVGALEPAGPLAATVAAAARRACADDPRFAPVRADELPAVRVRVAVVARPRPMGTPSDLAVGRDGVLVRRGPHTGVLLPAATAGRGWGAETVLARACLAAGLPPGAWREPDARVELFAAEELAGGPGGG